MRITRMRLRMVLSSALGISALLILGVSIRGCNRGWTESQIKYVIRAEVPPLSNRKYLESWFDRYGIAYFAAKDRQGEEDIYRWTDGGGIGDKTYRELAGLAFQDVSEVLIGTIEPPDANVDWLFPGTITIVFFLNKEGRCVGHWVQPFAYEL
jgi:hypothetical protein